MCSQNRLSVLLTPVVMGAVAEVVGIEAAFYVMGGVLLGLMCAIALHFHGTFVREDQKP